MQNLLLVQLESSYSTNTMPCSAEMAVIWHSHFHLALSHLRRIWSHPRWVLSHPRRALYPPRPIVPISQEWQASPRKPSHYSPLLFDTNVL